MFNYLKIPLILEQKLKWLVHSHHTNDYGSTQISCAKAISMVFDKTLSYVGCGHFIASDLSL